MKHAAAPGSAVQDSDLDHGTDESYVDFVYGSDDGIWRGVHRFSVLRGRSEGNDHNHDEEVVVRHSGAICDPRKDKHKFNGFLKSFHLIYATLLFREGVAELMKQCVWPVEYCSERRSGTWSKLQRIGPGKSIVGRAGSL